MKEILAFLCVVLGLAVFVVGTIQFVAVIGWWAVGLYVATLGIEIATVFLALVKAVAQDNYSNCKKAIIEEFNRTHKYLEEVSYLDQREDMRYDERLNKLEAEKKRAQLIFLASLLLTLGLAGDFAYLVWWHSFVAVLLGELLLLIVAVGANVFISWMSEEETSPSSTLPRENIIF